MRTTFSSFKFCGTIHWPWYFLQHSSMQSTVQSTVLPGKITFEEWFLSLDKENKNLWKTFPYLNGYFEVPFLLDKALWKESHNRLDSHSCDTLLVYLRSKRSKQIGSKTVDEDGTERYALEFLLIMVCVKESQQLALSFLFMNRNVFFWTRQRGAFIRVHHP